MDEILKLAEKHCYGKHFAYDGKLKRIEFFLNGVEDFYKAAFNAGLEAAIEACEHTVPRHAECQNKIANAIQKLEKK